ncbi:hypothetical protein ACWA2C_16805 [Priestia megaterium]
MELVKAYLEAALKQQYYYNGKTLKRLGRNKDERPLPREAYVPEGYERSNGSTGVIGPPPPPPLRYVGQLQGETKEEYHARMRVESKSFFLFLSSIIFGSSVISVVLVSLLSDREEYSVRFVPLPFLIFFVCAFVLYQKARSKYMKLKREREGDVDWIEGESPSARIRPPAPPPQSASPSITVRPQNTGVRPRRGPELASIDPISGLPRAE